MSRSDDAIMAVWNILSNYRAETVDAPTSLLYVEQVLTLLEERTQSDLEEQSLTEANPWEPYHHV